MTTTISLLDLQWRVLSEALDGAEPEQGNAGGTVALWAVAPSGHVVCVTDGDPVEPFSPRQASEGFKDTDGDEIDGEVVDTRAIAAAVYADQDAYMDGRMPISPLAIIPVENSRTSLDVAAAVIREMVRTAPRTCGGCGQEIVVSDGGVTECGGEGEGGCAWVIGEATVEIDGMLVDVYIDQTHSRFLAAQRDHALAAHAVAGAL